MTEVKVRLPAVSASRSSRKRSASVTAVPNHGQAWKRLSAAGDDGRRGGHGAAAKVIAGIIRSDDRPLPHRTPRSRGPARSRCRRPSRLLVLGLAWELWLAPTGRGTLAIKVLPLLLPLPGLAALAPLHLSLD